MKKMLSVAVIAGVVMAYNGMLNDVRIQQPNVDVSQSVGLTNVEQMNGVQGLTPNSQQNIKVYEK